MKVKVKAKANAKGKAKAKEREILAEASEQKRMTEGRSVTRNNVDKTEEREKTKGRKRNAGTAVQSTWRNDRLCKLKHAITECNWNDANDANILKFMDMLEEDPKLLEMLVPFLPRSIAFVKYSLELHSFNTFYCAHNFSTHSKIRRLLDSYSMDIKRHVTGILRGTLLSKRMEEAISNSETDLILNRMPENWIFGEQPDKSWLIADIIAKIASAKKHYSKISIERRGLVVRCALLPEVVSFLIQRLVDILLFVARRLLDSSKGTIYKFEVK
eukprot:gene2794-3233_t